MANKGALGTLAATDSSPRPGAFALGSAESRAAARAILEARKASEDELRFEVRSIVDGERINLDGLAETIRAARIRIDAGGEQAALPTIEDGQDFSRGRQADCLAERIRRARERVERMQGRDSTR
jgi:hypothetical protein